MSDKKEFPKTLYVRHEDLPYPFTCHGITQMVGHTDMATAVCESGNTMATYQLVSVDDYKKVVTRYEVIKKEGE